MSFAPSVSTQARGESPPPPNATLTQAKGGFFPATIDLGRHLWNSEVPFQLTFINGDSPITVQSIQSSCECTVIEESRYRGVSLAPNEHLSLEAVLKTEVNPGPKRRRITLLDDASRSWSSDVDVFVEGTWSLLPAVLELGDVVFDAGDPALTSFVVFSSDADQLLSVDDPGVPWLATRVSGSGGSGRWDILVTIRKDLLLIRTVNIELF
ncbi:MAG: hypothetical protein AMXMBFR47_13490 [Planctomycetota bacterium]